MSKKLSLLEKYEINIEKLDYSYIDSCENGGELEKIYKILLSKEEGYYPDLTNHTAKRLAIIKPNSKCLRTEEKVLKYADVEEVQEEIQSGLQQFFNSIKNYSRTNADEQKGTELESSFIPIRGTDNATIENVPTNQKQREVAENRSPAVIEEIKTESLTRGQLKELDAHHRNKGNNFYRAAEYKEALTEYTNCLKILPTAAVFNNRAITYIKLGKFDEALRDLDQCLSLDSRNEKSLLRKADVFMKLKKKSAALDVYCKIKEISGEQRCSDFVQEQIENLKKELDKEVPGKYLQIPDVVQSEAEIEEEYAKLIIPKKIHPSKSKQLVESFKEMNNKVKDGGQKEDCERKRKSVDFGDMFSKM